MRVTLLVLLTLSLVAADAAAETRYVTDDYRIMMRKGESTRHKIIRMLPSGTAVEVVSSNDDTGYSLVRLEDGSEGHVLTRMLLAEPIARERLAAVEAELAALRQAPDQLAARLEHLESEHQLLQGDYARLQDAKQRIEQELATIMQASADVVRITQERAELRRQVADLTRQTSSLQQENRDLLNQANQRWFLIGAGVLGGGIALGVLLPYLRLRRRKSGWGSL